MGILSLYRAGSRRKTRFLHNNTAAARPFSLSTIIRWTPTSSTGC